MAEVNVEHMEENAVLFEKRMGFPHDAEGLDLTEEQLVNFLLLCLRLHGIENDGPYYKGVAEEDMDYHDDGHHDEEYEECDCEHGGECECGHGDMMLDMPEDHGMKVKVMRVGGGNVHELMNELLGG